MLDRPPITPNDFFSNDAARATGFTDQFWFDAYTQWNEAIRNDLDVSFASIDAPRTLRMPFREGYADVLVRIQPEAHEHYAIRFTAFPADDETPPRQVSRWYIDKENRPVLGEAVLLDANFHW